MSLGNFNDAVSFLFDFLCYCLCRAHIYWTAGGQPQKSIIDINANTNKNKCKQYGSIDFFFYINKLKNKPFGTKEDE